MKIQQRQEYYEKMCAKGFPEIIAAAMAEQVDDWGLVSVSDHMVTNLFGFQEWSRTKEGFEFWSWLAACLK